MERQIISTDLIEYARSINLYARRHRIIFALDVGEFDQALALCRSAVCECEMCMKGNSTPQERRQHAQNLRTLRAFEAELSHAVSHQVPLQATA